MAVLANPRHEQFAQNLMRGIHPRLAAKSAGFLDSHYGNQLKKEPHIVARVNELLEEAATEAVMEGSEILTALTIMARRDIRHVLNPDAVKRDRLTGEPIIDPRTGQAIPEIEVANPFDWDSGTAAAVVSLEYDNNGRPKIKMVDKTKLLEMLGRARGLFKDNMSLTGPNGGPIETINSQMTPEQAAQLYQMTLGK